MRYSRKLVLALGMGLAGLGTTTASAESLADALVAAYKHSNLLDQNRAVLRAADEDVAQAVADLRPVLQWAANWSRTYIDNFNSTGIDRGTTSAELSLTAQMTLWDFGRTRASIDIAKETVLATREALRDIEQQVLLGAVSAYTQVRAAVENVSINENSVRVIGEELRAAQDRFDVGEVTRTDVALAEARLAAARATLAAARGELAAAREAYKAATGSYPGRLAAFPRPPKLPRSLDEARAIAQRSHPAILQAQRMVTVAELGIGAAAAERRPELTGTVQLSHDNASADTSYVGLELRQTIYAGGKLSSAHRKAIANRDKARASLLQAGVSVGENVANMWSQIGTIQAQIRATDQQIRAAQVAFRGVKEEATLGARTTLDVLDAEQDLLDARAARIDAEANLQVAIYSLLSSMGLLTAEHLNLGIPTYDPAAYYNAVRNAPVTSVQGESLDRVLRAIGRK
ncbi:TolC family outer membrane protein [Phaeovulum vinaykumarii]